MYIVYDKPGDILRFNIRLDTVKVRTNLITKLDSKLALMYTLSKQVSYAESSIAPVPFGSSLLSHRSHSSWTV